MKLKGVISFVLLLAFFALPATTSAAVFNVTDVSGLQTTLNTAAANGENDIINVAAGNYNVTTTITYSPIASEDYSLTVQGEGADSTILDGGDANQIMNIDTTNLDNGPNTDITVRDMTFQNGNNTVSNNGGGLFVRVDNENIIIENSKFIGNVANNNGGGVYALALLGTINFTNNTFIGNDSTNSSGGGIYTWSLGAITFTNNVFISNTALFDGGGISAYSNSAITLLNNVLNVNEVARYAGGAYVDSLGGTINIINNTIYDNNTISHNGGGIYFRGRSNATTFNLYNNIIWNNTAGGDGDDIYGYDDSDSDNTGAIVNLYNNNYSDFYSECDNTPGCVPDINMGSNRDEDPLLTPDFHLQAGSPCINKGDNSAPDLPATDFEGDPRIFYDTVDIGADEYSCVLDGEIFNLVTWYYLSILDRCPEPEGAKYWTGEIERIVALGIDIKEGFIALGKEFFNSDEYIRINKTDSEYLADLYWTFLGRAPDAEGEAFWLDQLAGGLTRNMVLNNFVFSPEFRDYMIGIFGDSSVRPEYTLVNDQYRGILSRLPEDGGYLFWLGHMQTAQCTGEAAVSDLTNEIGLLFITSPEYVDKGRSNGEFLEDMYDAIQRRAPDLGGHLFWLGLLDSGALSREEVLQEFVNSVEFQGRVQEVIDAGCILP
jgi:hypothetical protein